MRETIDVEDLLVWAYRDQAVEHMLAGMRRAVGRGGPRAYGAGPLAGLVGLGTRVDGGSAALAALGADAADDALAVHDAVLRLPRLLVDWQPGGEGGFALHWGDELARAGIVEGLDRSLATADGRAIPATWLEPAVLITLNARTGSRPEVWVGWVEGRGGRARDAEGRWIADRDAYRLTHDDVAAARAEYAAWHAGLVRLTGALDGERLANHRIGGPLAPAMPWAEGRKAAEAGRGATGVNRLTKKGKSGELTTIGG